MVSKERLQEWNHWSTAHACLHKSSHMIPKETLIQHMHSKAYHTIHAHTYACIHAHTFMYIQQTKKIKAKNITKVKGKLSGMKEISRGGSGIRVGNGSWV